MVHVTKVYVPDRVTYKSYIDKIYESGWITNNGPLVQELEKRLEKSLDVKNVVLVSSGTAALELAYKVLDINGEVITTPYSFVSTTNSLVYSSLKPVFADIDPETYNLNPANIEPLISENVNAIVPVHIYGNACEVEKIEDIAKHYNLKVVYDAAHAFDVQYKNSSLLGYGDISTISFHATKMFHTIEGGAIITNDDTIAEKAKQLRNHGMSSTDEGRDAGTNSKMNEIEAAMGLCMLDDMEKIIKGRRNVMAYYKEKLEGIVQFQKQNSNATQSVSYFSVLFKSEAQMLHVQDSLSANNINSKRYFYPSLDTLSYVEPLKPMEVSRDIANRILCLPFYHDLETIVIDKITSVIKQACIEKQ